MTTPVTPDTEELLNLVARGDVQARSLLLDRHRNRLRRMIGVYFDPRLRARVDPSDVVQDVLTEAAQQLAEYVRNRPIAFYPWLRQFAAKHLSRLQERHVRAGRRTVNREEFSIAALADESARQLVEFLSASTHAPDKRLMEAEQQARLSQVLNELSDLDRDVLVFRHLERLSYAEIAEIANITETAARKRYIRALGRVTRLVGLPNMKDRS